MPIIDVQVHCYERNHPGRPWVGHIAGPDHVTGDEMAKVLALARQPNVRIKISGACTLSHQRGKYSDIWPPVLEIINAFGVDRCMWGTDWTRATELLTYEQGVEPFRSTERLSKDDKAKLMGGTLEKVYKWTPARS